MNIFYLHPNPDVCATHHCDKHVCKMIIETAQMLSQAHWATRGKGPYKRLKTHANHPCILWVQISMENYDWMVELGAALCHEYTKRYGRIHKTQQHIEWLTMNRPKLPDEGFCEPPQCMPDEYKGDNTIEAYRELYRKEKSRFAKWKLGNIPEWY